LSPRELAILIGMCIVWGFHYVVLKTGVGVLPPLLYAALRMSLVAVLMSPFLRWRAGRMGEVLLAGICLGALNYAFLFTGVKHATASATAIAIELYVPFATILSIIFLGEQVGWRRTLGIALAFVGVAVVGLSRDPDGQSPIGIGVVLVAGCALTEAFAAILVKRIRGFKAYELLAWFGLIGAIGLWPTALLVEPHAMQALRRVDPATAFSVVAYSAIGASIIGHTAYYWLLQRLPVSLVAPSTLLTTLLGVAFSVAFLGERVTPPFLAGGFIALIGVAIVLFRTPKGRIIETGGAETVGLAPAAPAASDQTAAGKAQ
jgi:O-acetylserine/cysteine efflux transporter